MCLGWYATSVPPFAGFASVFGLRSENGSFPLSQSGRRKTTHKRKGYPELPGPLARSRGCDGHRGAVGQFTEEHDGTPRAIGGRARSALPVQPRRPEGVSKDLLHEYSRRMRRSKAGFEGLARAQRRG
jgi:hypothetical protein